MHIATRYLLITLVLAFGSTSIASEPQRYERELTALAGEVQALLLRVDRDTKALPTPNSILKNASEVQSRIYAIAMEAAEANSALEKQGGRTSLSFSKAEAVAQALALALDMTTHYYTHRNPKFRVAAQNALATARDLRTLTARD